MRELRNVVFHAPVRKLGGDELLRSDLPDRGTPPDAAAGLEKLDLELDGLL